MPLEIETKMQVDSHDPVRAALKAAGAEPVAKLLETNTYMDTPDLQLRARDEGLRVRLEKNLDTQASRVVITHKGPKQPGDVKTRPETELDASGEAESIAMLGALGYRPVLRFRKRRDRWGLGGCRVELDQLPLGCFVEIEGPSEEAVLGVRERLGLADRPLISTSYLALLVDEIEAGRLKQDDLKFDDDEA